MGATHAVSILTHRGDTTPITSMMEGTPAGISNIARITSMSGHTPVVIALITSMIEGLPRGSSIAPPPLPSKYHNRLTRKHSHSQPSHRSRSPRSPQHTRRTCHAQHSPSSSDSSLDNSSSTLLSDSSDTQSDTYFQYRATLPTLPVHRNRRRHSYRHRHSSEDSWVADTVVSCAPPIPRHLCRNLKQGKYVNFTSLLLPMDPLPLVPGMWQQRRKSSLSSEGDRLEMS